MKLWIGIVESRVGSHYEVNDVLRILDDVIDEVFRINKNNNAVQIVLGGHGQSGNSISMV